MLSICRKEGFLTSKQGRYRVPALAHVLDASKDENTESRVERIDTVIEELAQRT